MTFQTHRSKQTPSRPPVSRREIRQQLPENQNENCCRPALLRGDKSWGIERVMAQAEQNDLKYLFRLRMTANVRRSLDRAMRYSDWADAERGWQGKETTLRLVGWSRQRRIILLRRKLGRDLAITDRTNPAQKWLGFAEIGPDKELWEYAALVTSLDSEILTLGQLYRDRADCENVFDELGNQWGWGGFTTQDLTRCRLLADTGLQIAPSDQCRKKCLDR